MVRGRCHPAEAAGRGWPFLGAWVLMSSLVNITVVQELPLRDRARPAFDACRGGFDGRVAQVGVIDRLASLLLAVAIVGIVGLTRPSVSENEATASLDANRHQEIVPFVHLDESSLELGIAQIISQNHRRLDSRQSRDLARIIVDESRAEGVDPLFVTAVIKAESRFSHSAVSNKGAKGLMQLLPSTGQYISQKRRLQWSGVEGLYDPAYNIRLGIAYLKYLEEEFGFTQQETLIAYNWGPGNLLSARKRGGSAPGVTRRYADTILSEHKNWRQNLTIKVASLSNSAIAPQVL